MDGKGVRDGGSSVILFSAATHDICVPPGRKRVDEKSKELPAMRQLELSGMVVTADAMHPEVGTTQAILDADVDCVLLVKDNQPTLHTT